MLPFTCGPVKLTFASCGSRGGLQFDYFAFSKQALQVCAPTPERISTLVQKLMPLIDGGNAGDRPPNMIEDLVGDMRRHPKAGHPRDHGPAQIVQAPGRHATKIVKSTLLAREVTDWSDAV